MNIWITGTTRGLGEQLSDHYVSEGHWVGHFDRPRYDVSDPTSVAKFAAEMQPPDMLINNAAVGTYRFASMLSVEAAQEMVNTNILGTWYVTREAAWLMMKARHGTIVTISSIHARTTPPGTTMYAATKAAVEAMSGAFSKELAPFGITVNCVGLSPMDTDMMRATGTPEEIEKAIRSQVIPKMATVEDVVGMIDYFHANRMVTGQTIYLAGVR